jgi:hypothetical protein
LSSAIFGREHLGAGEWQCMSLPRAKAYRVIDKSAGDKAIRRVKDASIGCRLFSF